MMCSIRSYLLLSCQVTVYDDNFPNPCWLLSNVLTSSLTLRVSCIPSLHIPHISWAQCLVTKGCEVKEVKLALNTSTRIEIMSYGRRKYEPQVSSNKFLVHQYQALVR